MVKNLDNAGKFLMYPRFVQFFLEKQLEGMSSHKRIYVTPSHTKKIFGNMKRVGKGFSGRETPLFPTMVVQNQADIDEAVYKERDDSVERAAATATGLDADSGGGPRRQETMGDTIDHTRSENVSKLSNNLLLARVIDLENTKTAQAQEVISLKLRVKKLEKKGGSRTYKLKRLYKITLVDETQGRYGDDIMFDVSGLAGEEVFVTEQGMSDKDVNLSVDEVTLAQALASLKSAKVQEKANVVEEPSKSITTTPTLTTTTAATTITAASTRPMAKGLVIHEQEQAPIVSSQQPSHARIQDKGKAKMIEPEPVKKLSKKDQLKLDEEDDIQEKIEADQLLAKRLQARDQEELTIEERAILFQQLLEKRRKHFAAKRAEEKRNRPPTKAQQRSIMCTYLKNIEGWKPKYLKSKSFAYIQELFDKAMKRVNTFVDYRTELVEGSSKKADAEIAQESSSKRARDELEQESIKKQKVDEDKETTELKSLMEVIPDEEEVAVDAIPLATKPLSIVDWKIHKEGKKTYYQIKPVWNNAQRVNHQNFAKKTHPCAKKNMVPRAVLMKSDLVSVNTARQFNAAHTTTTVNFAKPMPKTVVNTARPKAVVNVVKGNNVNAVKASACWVWKLKTKVLDHVSKHNNASITLKKFDYGNPQIDLQDQGVIDSGYSRHMTGNMSYLTDYEEIHGGYVAFGENPKGGKITRKGTIKTNNLDFENVYFVRELKFNLFSISQMCDKKNSVLFNDTECIVLSPNFKLIDESQVLLRVPRKNNMYSVDLKNIVYKRGFTSLFAKSTSDESKIWHRRLGHLNFKTINKLVKGNLVRGLPSKLFENDQNCVACQKGKQHKASCKSKTENSISLPLHLLYMDLKDSPFNLVAYTDSDYAGASLDRKSTIGGCQFLGSRLIS
ncbi:putative ribonuclease H-like domain-containing protein [Tanacetum coccineum]